MEFAAAASVKFTATCVSASYKATAFVAPAPPTMVIPVVPATPTAASPTVMSPPLATPTFASPATSPKFDRMSPVVPRTGSYKEAPNKVVRPIEPVRRTSVWIIVVIAIGADRLGTVAVVSRRSETDAEGDALGVGVRSGEKTNTETNCE